MHIVGVRVVVATLLSAASLIAFSSAAEARWLRAESPLFVVYSDGGEDDLRKFTQKLQEFDGILRVMTGTTAPPSPGKLTVYLVRDHDELRIIHPTASPLLAGFYQANSSATTAVAVRNGQEESYTELQNWMPADTLLLHEYTHHFAARYFPGVYPTWCNEGLAEYFGAAVFKSDGVHIGDYVGEREYFLQSKPWIPVEKILFPQKENQDSLMFYSESWLIVHYFMDSDDGQKKLAAYLEAVGRGEDGKTAFNKIVGMDFVAFDQVMKNYLAKRKIRIRRIQRQTKPAEVAVTVLPPSADDLLLSYAGLMAQTIRPSTAPDRLADIMEKTARYPNDPLAIRTAAAAQIMFKAPENAEAILAPLLAQTPNDVEALSLKALGYMRDATNQSDAAKRAALWEKAKLVAAAIHKLDANHYPSLYIYGLYALSMSRVPSENTLNIMMLAEQLAPQVSDITFDTARALLKAGHPDQAKPLLERVAYAPHADDAMSERARGLLEDMAAEAANHPSAMHAAAGPAKAEP